MDLRFTINMFYRLGWPVKEGSEDKPGGQIAPMVSKSAGIHFGATREHGKGEPLSPKEDYLLFVHCWTKKIMSNDRKICRRSMNAISNVELTLLLATWYDSYVLTYQEKSTCCGWAFGEN